MAYKIKHKKIKYDEHINANNKEDAKYDFIEKHHVNYGEFGKVKVKVIHRGLKDYKGLYRVQMEK